MLLVDDEPRVLAGLRRSLYALHTGWSVTTAGSGEEALALLAAQPFDVVVSDMRMDKMTGAELMERVRAEHPDVVRFILTGQTSQEAFIAAARTAHQVLAKPCEPQVLYQTIQRSLRLRAALRRPRARAEATGLGSLPSSPKLYHDMRKLLAAQEVPMERVGDLVASDPAAAAKLLQVVNSPFFGMRSPVSSPQRAVVLLGQEAVQALVLGIAAYDDLGAAAGVGVPVDRLFERSLLTARLARKLAKDEALGPDAEEEAYLAGLMHDVGWMVLGTSMAPETRAFIAARTLQPDLSEEEALGACHCAYGAYLMALWGMSDVVVDAVAHHHDEAVAVQADAPVVRCVLLADEALAELLPLNVDPHPMAHLEALEAERTQARAGAEALMKEVARA